MTNSGKGPGNVLEVRDERLALGFARRVVRGPQDRRRVDRRRDDRREVRVEQLAALLRHAEARTEDRLRRSRAEEHDGLRLDDPELLLEPRLAGVDLELLGRRV